MDANLIQSVLDRAIIIQQIPAPTFSEHSRAAYILDQFKVEALSDVKIDQLGNVYGRLPGKRRERPLIVSAHLDTVFPEGTDLSVRRQAGALSGPGIGDNSLGLAGLFGLLWSLRRGNITLPDDLWLVANVGEEGLGDLCGMRAVVDLFGSQVRAYLVLEGMALGQVYHRGLGVQRYRITAVTRGGHSWVDFGRPSAIHELASLVTRLAAIPLPRNPRTSLNVGVISGGTSVNTIAAGASLELDLRSESEAALQKLVSRVLHLVQAANQPGVEIRAEQIGNRPVGEIPSESPLVQLAVRCLEGQGLRPKLNIGSTDANIPLSRNLPAIGIGLTSGQGAHTLNETIHTAPLALGLAQLVNLVEGIYQMRQAED